jgi:serine/threonine-protein kinase
LLHRDLKPENIFLARNETGELAKVLDFGVAKFLPADTQSTLDSGTAGGILVGTLRYMSTEQLRVESATAAWDVWALAVVSYEMLAGKHPFEKPSGGELQRAVLAGRFTPLAESLPEAPARCQDFFAHAFALEPQRRPASADAFLSELERTLSGVAG